MKTLTQLVGTTASNSSTLYPTAFTSLTGNNSAANVARGKALASDHHRYLIQKYFDNERTVSISTIGAMSLTLTGSLSLAATSATLNSAWNYASCHQLVNFSNGDQRDVTFTNGSTAISWSIGLSSSATASITTVGVQYYNIPANISKIKDDTINIGQLKYQPKAIQSIQEWNAVNFLPYTSDIPNYFFIYNGTLGIFPIPSTTGNIITFSYKSRVPDLSFQDYSTGNIANGGAIAGGITVTGSGTSWNSTGGYPLNTDISFYNLALRIDPPYGDGLWYPILKFTSDTALTLALPIVNAPNITGSSTYTIGQIPLLSEDFHDMLVYGPLMTYWSTVVKDKAQYESAQNEYQKRLVLLEDYAGTKQVNVDLGSQPQQTNPNLFFYSN